VRGMPPVDPLSSRLVNVNVDFTGCRCFHSVIGISIFPGVMGHCVRGGGDDWVFFFDWGVQLIITSFGE
jgi:hypothetical protein